MEKQVADAIITQYLPKIYGFAIKKSFSYEEAEDLCAEIVHEAYRSLRAAKEVLNMEGYIWRISKHTHAKYVASKKGHEGIAIDQIVIPFWEEGFSEEARDEIIRLRREIAFLTEKRREIVYLFYYKDQSVSAISKAMGIPAGTVKWHLNQAGHELQEGFAMERKIGKLGLSPIVASSIGHSGQPGSQGGPEYYPGR